MTVLARHVSPLFVYFLSYPAQNFILISEQTSSPPVDRSAPIMPPEMSEGVTLGTSNEKSRAHPTSLLATLTEPQIMATASQLERDNASTWNSAAKSKPTLTTLPAEVRNISKSLGASPTACEDY